MIVSKSEMRQIHRDMEEQKEFVEKWKRIGAKEELERLKGVFQQYYDGAEDSYWISICIERIVNRLKELGE